MEKFQIVEITQEQNHAGTKATADIARIADGLGFVRVPVSMDTAVDNAFGKARRQAGYLRDWKKAYKIIKDNSVLLLQHPFHHKQLTRDKTLKRLKNEKHVRIIALIHDVEELRAFRYNDYYAAEFETMIELADVFIVHNDSMKRWFAEKGIPDEKLIPLEIFDYLCDTSAHMEYEKTASITIAGNLDTEKCGYIGHLDELKGVGIDLYGPNYDERLSACDNICYHGSFPSDEVPYRLNKGFGLVWDGESIDGCKGLSGQYLRYNNPHKLSLYLASGIPVIIWNEAAEAEFVRTNKVGLCVDSLNELKERLELLGEEEHSEIKKNVDAVKAKLTAGYYADSALKKAVEYLDEKH